MKILYVSNGSNFLSAGGMEYHLIDITGWLERNGVETALAVRKGTVLHQLLESDASKVYPLTWTGFNKIFSFFQVGRALRDFSPDIVSINREKDILRIYLIVKFMGYFLRKKPKIVAVFHNLGWKASSVLGKLDGIIFPNDYLRQEYTPQGALSVKQSAIIHHGIALPKIDPSEKLNPQRERRYFKGVPFPLIGMVGEMRKNQGELIDIASCLKQKKIDFTVAFVGRGSEEEIRSLRAKIEKKGLSQHFIFTGRVDRKYMPDVYYDLDISVTTNRHEPFGMVFIESIASYAPVVAYNSGGPVEILTKGGGILVNGGPEEMAEKIFSLITDHELRNSLSAAGRESAEKNFSIDAMGAQHHRFYSNLLQEHY